MISSELLKILVCPVSKKPLRVVNPESLDKIKSCMKSGEIKNIGGESPEYDVEGLLFCEDTGIAYPIREGIPVLLEEHGLKVVQYIGDVSA